MKKFSTLIYGLMVLTLLVALFPAVAVRDVAAAGPAWHHRPWQVPGDFATIQEAVDSAEVDAGDTIMLGSGNHTGVLLSKALRFMGKGKATINSGPAHSSGLIQGFRLLEGSGGSSFSNLTFKVDLAIMNGASVNDVTVENCNFFNAIQAVSNWGGSGWKIQHNDIVDLRTRNGGGIAILIGDRFATEAGVKNNIVAQNKISGTVHVWENDGGGYNGTGIVLYADFRYGFPGALAITRNQVINNKIALKSDNPEVVDVCAIELTDTRDDETLDCVIFDNSIGFNDLRGTELKIVLTPEKLGDCNKISRNLPDDRGHGRHPSNLHWKQHPNVHRP